NAIPAALFSAFLMGIVAENAVAQIAGTTWFPMGPAPIMGFYKESSGRAISIAVNPANGDDIWLGTAGGGLCHSTNGGVNWQPTSDNEAPLAIGALALDGCNQAGCTTIYAGTGENGIRRDTYYGRGLLVGSVSNTGVSWTMRGASLFSLGSINNV